MVEAFLTVEQEKWKGIEVVAVRRGMSEGAYDVKVFASGLSIAHFL